MKKTYPNYKHLKITSEMLERNLDKKELEILKEFEIHCLGTACKDRVKDIKSILLQFRDVIEIPLYKITLQDVREFLSILNQSNRKSHNRIKTIVKRFLKFYYEDWSTRFQKLEDIKLKNEFDEKRVSSENLLTPEELKKLCHATTNYRDKAIVLCLYELGCRPEELSKLKWRDIKFKDEGFAEVSIFSGKTKTSRNILIKDSVLVLKDWKQHYRFTDIRSEDFIFCTSQRDKQMGKSAFSLLISRLGEKAKLERHIFPYLFRHSRLTELHKEKKMPSQIWKMFAGHKPNSNMISVYTHLNNDDLTQCLLKDIYPTKELSVEEKDEIKKLKLEIEDLKFYWNNTFESLKDKSGVIGFTYPELQKIKVKTIPKWEKKE